MQLKLSSLLNKNPVVFTGIPEQYSWPLSPSLLVPGALNDPDKYLRVQFRILGLRVQIVG